MSPSKVAQWTAFLRRNRFTNAPDSFLDVVNFLDEFLRPIVTSLPEKQDGNFIWDAGGPWRSAI
jgi:hypothetical protein